MAERVFSGSPEPLGVTPDAKGVNVAVFSKHATAIEFCLFDRDDREIARIALPERTGDVFHAHVGGVALGARYGLRAHGPYAPGDGHRFNANKLLVDPHALALDRPFRLDRAMFGYKLGDPLADLSFDETDSGPVMPKAVVTALEQQAERLASPVFWSSTIVYELQVRAFTRRHPDVPEALRGTFAGLAHPAAVAHLKKLGVTTVEILPAAAWIDERHLGPLGLANAWGYNSGAFLAPDPRLAPGGWADVRQAARALHAAGIEIVLDVVVNHSGESDELGPTISFRGLDNASYYRLIPDNKRYYINDMGCGNCLALAEPPVVRLAMDSLRAWITQGEFDGFRFDLGVALGRRANGFDPTAPLLAAIGQDPVLRDVKLIAEPWDIGPGGYQLGRFPGFWGEWNDRYRDAMRRFWRGDDGMTGEFATRFAGSEDFFADKRRPSRGVNFITAHDGFTLADLVAYTSKHNEANGEGNRDGNNDNLSWNHGVEGPTDDPGILALRRRDQRNLLATLILSRGTPMLSMGSELGHTQRGNNNAYAQDNDIAWIDWAAADMDLAGFVGRLIALRHKHPALRQDFFLTGRPLPGNTIPDVEWRRSDSHPLSGHDWNDPALRTIVIVLCAGLESSVDFDRVTIVVHRGGDPIDVALPEPRQGSQWSNVLDSGDGTAQPDDNDRMHVAGRSVVVLAEIAAAGPRRGRQGVDPVLLGRLADAAGIAADWWDVSGNHHVVPDETRRVLLRGMGFSADSTAEARDSLGRLSERKQRRPLPEALVSRFGEPLVVRLAAGKAGLPRWLRLVGPDGGTETIALTGANAQAVAFATPDGRGGAGFDVTLPPQPIGRHALTRDDDPDCLCHLTIAPKTCYLPPILQDGGKAFGLAAHLYTLRRVGDQGIGDFSTLGRFAEASARHGAVILGLNPLHVMFSDDRERASPYHPCDRRFLDPIFIDIAALDLRSDGPGSLAGEAAALSALPMVDYTRVWALKSAALEQAFAAFDAAGRQSHATRAFADFIAERGAALADFACFATLAETRPRTDWRDWSDGYADVTSPAVKSFAMANARRVRFHMFLQWLADLQLRLAARRAASAGMSIGFYRDLAVGSAPDGAEAWSQAPHLVGGATVGSPPDPFSADGQIWHLPPINPLTLAASNFSPFSGPIEANMRHAGALRIDHAMGLQRLFLVPHGGKASEGAYVAYPREDLLGHLALASAERQCVVVGEDLGTVPEGFRERLAEDNILSYRVLWFEREGASFKKPDAYPAKAVACVSTHDLPTLNGWWAGADIAERHDLHLADDNQFAEAKAARAVEKQTLVDALGPERIGAETLDQTGPMTPAIAEAIHAFLAETPCALVLAQADDLTGEIGAVNLPGTDRERPNWRRKLGVDVDAVFENAEGAAILRAIADRH